MNKSFGESNLDAEDENVRKIKEVADLIRTDIRKVILRNGNYPAGDQMFSKRNLMDVIPHSVRLLLSEIICKNKKKHNYMKHQHFSKILLS